MGSFWGVGADETGAIINAMTERPSTTVIRAIDDLVIGLKADGWWNEIGYLIIPTLHNATDSLINWKNPSQRAVNVGCSFSALQGFTGDGTSATYLETINPSQVAGYAQDTAHVFVWVENGTSTVECVQAEVSGDRLITINPRSGAGNYVARLNRNANVTVGAVAARNGLFHVRRTVAASIVGYRNGSSVGTPAAVSTGVQNAANRVIWSVNDRCLAYGIGGSSAANPANLNTRLRTFYTALGTTFT